MKAIPVDESESIWNEPNFMSMRSFRVESWYCLFRCFVVVVSKYRPTIPIMYRTCARARVRARVCVCVRACVCMCACVCFSTREAHPSVVQKMSVCFVGNKNTGGGVLKVIVCFCTRKRPFKCWQQLTVLSHSVYSR